MPSRWDADCPWRPFIPTSSSKPSQPWFLLDPAELQASRPPANEYQSELRSLEVCASHICQKYPEYRGRRPQEYFGTSFLSLDSIRASQEAMLDRIAFLSWCTAWYSELLTLDLRQLPAQATQVLTELRDAFGSRAGVIVDLANDWKTVNFPLWAYHGIPILFKWTAAEQEQSRFSHISPGRFPHSGTIEQGGGTYDWFFQDHSGHSSVRSGHGIRRDGNYIIDFEGWKRRSLSKAAARQYFEWGNIPFEVMKGRCHDQALFFRWRTKISQVQSKDTDLDNSDSDHRVVGDSRGDAESEELAIRELYRPHHAPHSNNTYDIDTGLLLTPLPPTPFHQTHAAVLTSNSSHATRFSPAMAPYPSRTSHSSVGLRNSGSVHESQWPRPWAVDVNSRWSRPPILSTGGWAPSDVVSSRQQPYSSPFVGSALPTGAGQWSQPDFRHRADQQHRNASQRFPAAPSSNSARGIPTRHNSGGWSQPNFGRRWDDGQRPLPRWPSVKDSVIPETSVHTRRNAWRGGHKRGAIYHRDRSSRVPRYEDRRLPTQNAPSLPSVPMDLYPKLGNMSSSTTAALPASTSLMPSSSLSVVWDQDDNGRLSPIRNSSSRSNIPGLQVPEIPAPRSDPMAAHSSTLLPSTGPVRCVVSDDVVSKEPKTRITFEEYKARKRFREERDAAPECGGSGRTKEGISDSPVLMRHVNVAMSIMDGHPMSNMEGHGTLLDGPSLVLEHSVAIEPEVPLLDSPSRVPEHSAATAPEVPPVLDSPSLIPEHSAATAPGVPPLLDSPSLVPEHPAATAPEIPPLLNCPSLIPHHSAVKAHEESNLAAAMPQLSTIHCAQDVLRCDDQTPICTTMQASSPMSISDSEENLSAHERSSPVRQSDFLAAIQVQEATMPSIVNLLNYSASRIRTASLKCSKRPLEVRQQPWWDVQLRNELDTAAFIVGLGLGRFPEVQIPEVIRSARWWVDSKFVDETLTGRIADSTGDPEGLTRVLQEYWDDWWNLPEDLENVPENDWWQRYGSRDYGGVLSYADQVGISWLSPGPMQRNPESGPRFCDLKEMKLKLERTLNASKDTMSTFPQFWSGTRERSREWQGIDRLLVKKSRNDTDFV